MTLRQRLKGWRTVIVGFLIGVPVALLEALEALQIVDLQEVLPPPWGQRAVFAVAMLMIVLRLITTGRVGAKEDEE
jgi:hypothetical protein